MIDKTTLGITAEPAEVEAVLHNLCGYHLSEPDPLTRYNSLTREQVLYDALVLAVKRERGRALADLVAKGHTLTQIAASTNLQTRQRVQRLIAISKAAEEAAAAVQEASRQFEEKLAAVHATLDEVVSGIIPTPVAPAPVAPAPVAPAPVAPASVAPASVVVQDPAPVEVVVETVAEVVAVEPPTNELAYEPGYNSWEPSYEPQDPDVILEPTQAMPAFRPLVHPTKEMPPTDDAPLPWWRRSRDTGAA